MRADYERAQVGDPPIFMRRVAMTREPTAIQYCAFEWSEDPFDPPLEGDVWACTRVPGHPPPHVAEGFRAIHAIHQESSSASTT